MKLYTIRIPSQCIILSGIILVFTCFCTLYLCGYALRNKADYYILEPVLIQQIKEQGIRDNKELFYYKKQGVIFIPSTSAKE